MIIMLETENVAIVVRVYLFTGINFIRIGAPFMLLFLSLYIFHELILFFAFCSLVPEFLIFVHNVTRLVPLYELKFGIKHGLIISVSHLVNLFGCCYQIPLCFDCYLLIS